ncbi:unnamed protein product [Peniophora sp. CBMAI 1063]|nr:unnamed protein product [Peniophora sp. CBMAI 1063]
MASPFIHDTSEFPENFRALWNRTNHSCLTDSMDEALLGQNTFDKLHVFSSTATLSNELEWVKTHPKKEEYTLCERARGGSCQEVHLLVSGVVAEVNLLPFTHRDQAHLQTNWSQPGTQSIAIMGLGNPAFLEATRALKNIYALASLECPSGLLKDYREVSLYNEPLIVAQTPLATHPKVLRKTQTPTVYSRLEDPYGIVGKWAQRRNWTITDENRISVSRAIRTDE